MLKFFLKLVLLIVAVAAGRFAYEKAIDLPQFDLKGIDLTGNCDLSEDSVTVLSGLRIGQSVYRQNLKYALSSLSSHPAVIECSVDRGFDFDINIEIEMAEPALLIKGDGLYCLSQEGVVLPFRSDIPVLPLISGKKFTHIRPNERLRDSDILRALDLYRTMMRVSPALCLRLSEINFSSGSMIKVYLSPKGTIAVLDKRNFVESVQRMTVLNDSGMLKGNEIFDLRFGTMVIESSLDKGIL